jgi:hypothetical protein
MIPVKLIVNYRFANSNYKDWHNWYYIDEVVDEIEIDTFMPFIPQANTLIKYYHPKTEIKHKINSCLMVEITSVSYVLNSDNTFAYVLLEGDHEE